MSQTILDALANVEKASQEQAAASQALTQEVAGKMAEIDVKASGAILPLGENSITYYVNAGDGSDTNSGINVQNPFKTLNYALSIAAAPENRGKSIVVYVEGGHDYHLSADSHLYHRTLYISARQSSNRANLYFDGRVVGSSLAMYGFGVWGGSISFANLNVYTPIFSEVNGHDGTIASGGMFGPSVYSMNSIYFASCSIYIGDSYFFSPFSGDTHFVHLNYVTIGRRTGFTTTLPPITTFSKTPFYLSIKDVALQDGLELKEGSLFGGLLFTNGVPTNSVTNAVISEV